MNESIVMVKKTIPDGHKSGIFAQNFYIISSRFLGSGGFQNV